MIIMWGFLSYVRSFSFQQNEFENYLIIFNDFNAKEILIQLVKILFIAINNFIMMFSGDSIFLKFILKIAY